MPEYYRTDAGGWNDSSDYNRTNIGEIYVKCQYTDTTGTSVIQDGLMPQWLWLKTLN